MISLITRIAKNNLHKRVSADAFYLVSRKKCDIRENIAVYLVMKKKAITIIFAVLSLAVCMLLGAVFGANPCAVVPGAAESAQMLEAGKAVVGFRP